MVMHLKLRQLEVLRAVIETGSVTDAAERLHVSQPATSKLLSLAEAQLGFPLFLRERGRLVVTSEARVLLPEIIRATAAAESVQRLAEDLREQRTGLLKLAAPPALGNTLLAEAITRFRAARPEVQVTLQHLLNHEVVDVVADHAFDLGVLLAPADDLATEAVDLCAAELVCVMPANHPLARRDEVGAADLRPWPLISFSRHQPIGSLVEDAYRQAGLRRRIAIEVMQTWTACALAHAGAGVAVVDGFSMIGVSWPGLASCRFTPPVPIVARLLRPRLRPLSRLAQGFVDELEAVVASRARQGRLRLPPFGVGAQVPRPGQK